MHTTNLSLENQKCIICLIMHILNNCPIGQASKALILNQASKALILNILLSILLKCWNPKKKNIIYFICRKLSSQLTEDWWGISVQSVHIMLEIIPELRPMMSSFISESSKVPEHCMWLISFLYNTLMTSVFKIHTQMTELLTRHICQSKFPMTSKCDQNYLWRLSVTLTFELQTWNFACSLLS